MASKPRQKPDPRRIAETRGQVAFLLSEFTVPHLLSTYKAFRGDVAMAIVLGEIGQHNVRRFYLDPRLKAGPAAEKTLAARLSQHAKVGGCNALSISRSTGLARETVRRKVVKLQRRGWIIRDERGHLLIVPEISQQFGRFNDDSLAVFLDVAARLHEVLDIAPQRAPSRGDRSRRREPTTPAQGR
jgi:hypothetical protein